MAQLIQIAPGVLFSSDVLSPEWGRIHRRDELGAEAGRDVRAADPSWPVVKANHSDASEAPDGQMLLLWRDRPHDVSSDIGSRPPS